MPGISTKGHQMPESPIRKLVPFAEKAKKAGKKVLHLNIGQPDIESPKEAIDAVKNMDLNVIEYSHSAGFESYRKGLAEYYRGVNIDVNFEQIMVTTGGSEALLFAFMSCFNPGDELIVPEPFYANYNGFAVSAGINVVPVPATIDRGFALPPVSEFEDKITEKTKGILICNPGNPTGYLYSRDELETLRDIVKKHDLFLFADEVYREFVYDGEYHTSIMELEGIEENAVLVDSVSKRYSMCGARIGAVVSRNQELMSTMLKFGQARLSPPTLAQIAAEGALKTPKSYFEKVSREYNDRRNLMVDGLNEIEGVRCPKPSGSFYCVAELPVDNTERFCQWMLESFEYENETVMMAPCAGFYSTPGMGEKEVRIAYVLEKESLKRALKCLEEGIKAYPGKD
ncbi:pyridoxal phosphate-dependent aminotransferase [Salibacter halophilus]|uniref:Aminotransferase n=1 Tax=Salibacter halophilus TaxID=1803916 RepID=A0A6N6MC51_9FLAO|nr:pyridoxal phosphate-dependent aminotransferase [Salibacter halophilus]KAB1066113.1 pyridoxal phosphate-dependent aminotransferase [Salibacter halophilus]